MITKRTKAIATISQPLYFSAEKTSAIYGIAECWGPTLRNVHLEA